MGQSTAGTNLTTTAAAAGREPCFQFWVDWDEYGWVADADLAAHWTDESARVQEMRGDMQGVSWQKSLAAVGSGVVSVAYVILDNGDFRFSPSNTGGALYADIADGAIHFKRAVIRCGFYDGATAEYTRQMTGYIVAARPNYAARTMELEIRDRGADLARTKMSTGPFGSYTRVYRDHTAKDYLDHLVAQWNGASPALGKDDIAAGDCVFDTGMMILPVAWMNDENVWGELQAVAESQLGRVWFDKDGDLHFQDGRHWVTPGGDAWDDPTVVQATLVMKFKTSDPAYEFPNVVNHVKVDYSPWESQAEATIYTCREVLAVPPGGSITHKSKYGGPVDAFEALATTGEEGTSDYWAVSAGGTPMTGDITITASDYSAWSSLLIENADPVYTAYVTKLIRRGHLFEEQDSDSKYETEDAASIPLHGKTTLPVHNKYIQSLLGAMTAGDFILARFVTPVEVVVLAGVPARPWLEQGDRVHAQETAGSGVHADYLIGRLEWQFAPKAGFTQTLHLLAVADLFPLTDWFVIGTSKYGAGVGHGHLFW